MATAVVKRRQRVLKPRSSLVIIYRWSLRRVGHGGSTGGTASGEVPSARPGSWNGAEAQDGLPGNLRDPARVHGSGSRKWDLPAEKKDPAREAPSSLSGAPRRARNGRATWDLEAKQISDRECRSGKS
jgi:hypothetical protein